MVIYDREIIFSIQISFALKDFGKAGTNHYIVAT